MTMDTLHVAPAAATGQSAPGDSRSLGELLHASLASAGSRVVYEDAERGAGHRGRDLAHRVDDHREHLRRLLPASSRIVALCGHNDDDYLALYIALQASGACVAEINPEWPDPLLQEALVYLGASRLLVRDEHAQRVLDLDARWRVLAPLGAWAWLAREDEASTLAAAAALPADVNALAFTGGTDGTLKAAMLTPSGYLHVLAEVTRYLRQEPEDIVGTSLPWQHGYGKSVVLSALLCGARFCRLPRHAMPAPLLSTLAARQVSVWSVVPVQLRPYLRGTAPTWRPHLRAICVAGGALAPLELARAQAGCGPGCALVPMYGLTEMTTRVSYVPLGAGPDKLGSAGIPLRGVEVRVSCRRSGECAGEGEIWVRGPNAMRGYWRRPEASAEACAGGGWVRTGDYGRIDGEGYLWIRDRCKNIVKRAGTMVYPSLLEAFARARPEVAEAVALGIPRAGADDELCLFVVAEDQGVDERALCEGVREQLGPRYVPTTIRCVAEIPRNSQGKVLRRALLQPSR